MTKIIATLEIKKYNIVPIVYFQEAPNIWTKRLNIFTKDMSNGPNHSFFNDLPTSEYIRYFLHHIKTFSGELTRS